MDASTNFDYLTDQTNNGKGLIFPRADLTTWSFKVNLLDGFTFPSAYDGMIVYNMATGNTPTTGNNSTVSTVVRPGYYIFSNPTGANTTSVSSGTWVRLNDAQITNIPSGSILPNVSTSVTGDVFYHTTNGLEVFNGAVWVVSGGGVSALATPTGSNANGGAISGTTLTLSLADATNPGLVSTGTQSFAGAKTFTSAITAPTTTNTINNLIINSGALSGITDYSQASGNFAMMGTGTFGTGTGVISLNGNTTLAAGKTLALTGSTSGTLGFTVPATVTSYSLTWPSAVATTAGQVLTSTTGGVLSWTSPTTGVTTLGSPSSTSYANGGYISGSSLYLAYADGTNPGLLSTVTQSIAGTKTFTSAITAPTTTNTINSLIINAGALSGITGYTQASGNFAISGTGTFSTGSGAVTLNGAATAASSLTVTGTAALNGNTTLATGKTLTLTGLNSSLLKTNASGVVSAAVAGTDYQSPISLGTTVDATTANGATFASNVLTLGFATGSYPGLVSTAAQTFAGAKIFSNNVSVGGTLGVTGATTLSSTLSVTGNQTNTGNFSQTGTGTFSTGTGAVSLNGNTTISGTNTLTVGTGATTLGGSLSVGGAASNDVAYNAGSATTIDFTQSNLAYTTASAGAFTLSGLKDGGTYTLAVQGTTTGTASFTQSGMTFKSTNNGATTSGYQTVYTFIVMGTTVYFWMNSGF